MDKNDFDKAFNSKDKELWRKLNKNKKKRPLESSEQIQEYESLKVDDVNNQGDLIEEVPFVSHFSDEIDDINDSLNDENLSEADFCDVIFVEVIRMKKMNGMITLEIKICLNSETT